MIRRTWRPQRQCSSWWDSRPACVPRAAQAKSIPSWPCGANSIGLAAPRRIAKRFVATEKLEALVFQRLQRLLVSRQVHLLILGNVPDRELPVGDRLGGVADGGVAAGEPDIRHEGVVGMRLAVGLENRQRAF